MSMLDSHVIAKIDRLDLRARKVVEGSISGMHKSPFKGFSVEFAQHRGYVPGDDLKHLDWKVWGKNERFYIKQYEAETNLITTILVDSSASMDYKGKNANKLQTKYAYAQLVAASISYLILNQSDAVAIGVFSDQEMDYVKCSTRKDHLQRICALLEKKLPKGDTGIFYALNAIAERGDRRGLVVLVSDFFEDVQGIISGFQRLRHCGHEIIAVHVLDQDELSFPFEGMAQFKGLEQFLELKCHPRSVKRAYLDELHKHLNALKSACLKNDIDYVLANTDQPVDVILSAYLAKREHAARSGVRAVRS
jgi:uncharacterized protein (DUF58 family)